MKKIRLFTLFGLVLVSCSLVWCINNEEEKKGNSNWDFIIEEINNDDVIAYNDNLVEVTSLCFESEAGLDSVYTAWTADELQESIDLILKECNNSLEILKEVPAWEGDSSLRDAVLPIIELEITYYEKFKDLVPFQDLDNDSFTRDQLDAYNAVQDALDSIDEQISAANEKLIHVQEEFAERHWYELDGADVDDDEDIYTYEDLENLDDSLIAAVDKELDWETEVNE